MELRRLYYQGFVQPTPGLHFQFETDRKSDFDVLNTLFELFLFIIRIWKMLNHEEEYSTNLIFHSF